jgi:hypothetical protein
MKQSAAALSINIAMDHSIPGWSSIPLFVEFRPISLIHRDGSPALVCTQSWIGLGFLAEFS